MQIKETKTLKNIQNDDDDIDDDIDDEYEDDED